MEQKCALMEVEVEEEVEMEVEVEEGAHDLRCSRN